MRPATRWDARRRSLELVGRDRGSAGWPPRLEAWVDAAAPPAAPAVVLTWWMRSAGALALVGILAGGRSGLVVALIVATSPGAWVAARQHLRSSRRRVALPTVVDSLASSLRGGASLHAALTAAIATAPILAADLHRMVDRLDAGTPARAALDEWAADLDPDVRLVGHTLVLLSDVGGHRAAALDRLAAVLRSRHELRGRRHALAAQARFSALVMAVAPVAFATLSMLTDARVADFLLGTAAGLACALTGAGLAALGAVWMVHLTGEPA